MRKWLAARLADIGPNRDSHNERIKLIALTLNAAGVAAVVAGVLGPLFDRDRRIGGPDAIAGIVFWAICVLAAFEVLGYIRSKD